MGDMNSLRNVFVTGGVGGYPPNPHGAKGRRPKFFFLSSGQKFFMTGKTGFGF